VTTDGPDGESQARVTSCLTASVPGLDAEAVRAALTTARAEQGRALREIDALLKEHPGALMASPAAYPLALVRLAHALMDAGYQAVVAPACTGCGRITIVSCPAFSGQGILRLFTQLPAFPAARP